VRHILPKLLRPDLIIRDMKHLVFINSKNQIEIRIVGPIQYEDAQFLSQSAITLETQLQDIGKDVKVLADATHAGDLDAKGGQFIASMLKDSNLSKLAFFGGNENVVERQKGLYFNEWIVKESTNF
jgi:hypothetical protein